MIAPTARRAAREFQPVAAGANAVQLRRYEPRAIEPQLAFGHDQCVLPFRMQRRFAFRHPVQRHAAHRFQRLTPDRAAIDLHASFGRRRGNLIRNLLCILGKFVAKFGSFSIRVEDACGRPERAALLTGWKRSSRKLWGDTAVGGVARMSSRLMLAASTATCGVMEHG